MKNKDPFCFQFLISELPKSVALLSGAIDGHSGFDFEYQMHDNSEIITIEDCEPNGIFNTKIPMELENREDGQYLVFSCTIPVKNQIREVAIFVPSPIEVGLQVEDDRYQGIVHITNSIGDQYWFYF